MSVSATKVETKNEHKTKNESEESKVTEASDRIFVVDDDNTFLETVGYVIPLPSVNRAHSQYKIKNVTLVEDSKIIENAKVGDPAYFSTQDGQIFELHTNTIIASSFHRNEHIFHFQVLTESAKGKKVILNFDINIEKYCRFPKFVAKKTERLYKMLELYLNAAYVGPSLDSFENEKKFKMLCETIGFMDYSEEEKLKLNNEQLNSLKKDVKTWENHLSNFSDEKRKELESLRQKLRALIHGSQVLQQSTEDTVKQKKQILDQMFNIIKIERGNLLRKDFLTHFLISHSFLDSHHQTFAFIQLVNFFEEIARFITQRWNRDNKAPHFKPAIVQLLDYIYACGTAGKKLFLAFAKWELGENRFFLVTKYRDVLNPIKIEPKLIACWYENGTPKIREVEILKANWSELKFTPTETQFLSDYLLEQWGIQKTPYNEITRLDIHWQMKRVSTGDYPIEQLKDPIPLNTAIVLAAQANKSYANNQTKNNQLFEIIFNYIRTLLNLGVKPNSARDVHYRDAQRDLFTEKLYPLEVACSNSPHDYLEILELLFQRGANVFLRSQDSLSLLDRLVAGQIKPNNKITLTRYQDFFCDDGPTLGVQNDEQRKKLKQMAHCIFSQLISSSARNFETLDSALEVFFPQKGLHRLICEYNTNPLQDISALFEDAKDFDELKSLLLGWYSKTTKTVPNNWESAILYVWSHQDKTNRPNPTPTPTQNRFGANNIGCALARVMQNFGFEKYQFSCTTETAIAQQRKSSMDVACGTCADKNWGILALNIQEVKGNEINRTTECEEFYPIPFFENELLLWHHPSQMRQSPYTPAANKHLDSFVTTLEDYVTLEWCRNHKRICVKKLSSMDHAPCYGSGQTDKIIQKPQ